ncbi:MAG: quinol:cytochrome C oxidoreductase [Bacteroidetes bacterium]|nr:quinol:cytochrome C oxidoreductase [Bacteroidota bacterium]
MEERYTMNSGLRNTAMGLMLVGVVFFVINLVTGAEAHRIWANFLLNNVYFMLISLGAIFFMASHRLSNAGWHIGIHRILESMGSIIWWPGILLIITFIIAREDIFHWTDQALYIEGTEDYDKIIAHKAPYLNNIFFLMRMAAYVLVWGLAAYMLRKWSLRADSDPSIKPFRRMNTISGIFIVFFAVSTSTFAWDWIMSTDAHWFSTLFGWYVFASFWVTAIATVTLILLYLKKLGYLKSVNINHLHDLGKYMFAFTIMWTYLWFSQYMLIWYANMPEETYYYVQRIEHYKFLFFANLIINFCIPFFGLMSRDAKRNPKFLVVIALVIVCGHWIDFFVMIMPGIMGSDWHVGLLEIGMALTFAGAFILIVFRTLSKAPLMMRNHPYLNESMTYNT